MENLIVNNHNIAKDNANRSNIGKRKGNGNADFGGGAKSKVGIRWKCPHCSLPFHEASGLMIHLWNHTPPLESDNGVNTVNSKTTEDSWEKAESSCSSIRPLRNCRKPKNVKKGHYTSIAVPSKSTNEADSTDDLKDKKSPEESNTKVEAGIPPPVYPVGPTGVLKDASLSSTDVKEDVISVSDNKVIKGKMKKIKNRNKFQTEKPAKNVYLQINNGRNYKRKPLQARKTKQVRRSRQQGEMHKCSFCTYASKYKYNVKLHSKIHTETEERPWKCSECTTFFKDLNRLENHQKKFHSRNSKTKDKVEIILTSPIILEESTIPRSEIEKPMKRSPEEDSNAITLCDLSPTPSVTESGNSSQAVFWCPFCESENLAFTNSNGLIEHLNKYHKESDDNDAVVNNGALIGASGSQEQEVLIENIMKRANCVVALTRCDGMFLTPKRRKSMSQSKPKKIRTVDVDAGNLSETTNSNFPSTSKKIGKEPAQSELSSPKKDSNYRRITFKEKPSRLTSKTNGKLLSSTYKSVSSIINDDDSNSTRAILHKCSEPLCSFSSLTPGILKRHMRVHTKSTDKPLKCLKCNAYFRKLSSLRVHESYVHSGRSRCHVCRKQIVPSSLEEHMKTHSKKNGPWKCPKCDSFFVTEPALRRHEVQNHQGARKVACRTCGKFVDKFNLHIHMRVHTGETPYSCSKCQRKFKWCTSYLQHIKKCKGSKEENIPIQIPIPERPESQTPVNEAEGVEKTEICSNLDLNAATEEITKNEAVFKCPVCPDQAFASAEGLIQHLQATHQPGSKEREEKLSSAFTEDNYIEKKPNCSLFILGKVKKRYQ